MFYSSFRFQSPNKFQEGDEWVGGHELCCLVSALFPPKTLDQSYKDTTLTLNLLNVLLLKKKRRGGGETFLLISSTHSKVLEVNIMVRSGSFRHAVQSPPGQHNLEASWRFSSQPRTPSLHSSKFNQRLPSVGQGDLSQPASQGCLDLLLISPPFFFLNPELFNLSWERQRHLLFGCQQ